MKVQEKVVVVTGAGSGIGRELALCLLAKGARVAGVDLSPESLDETARLAGFTDRFCGLVANVADLAAVEALPAHVVTRFGAVDAIINNAGIIQPFRRLNDLDYATIDRVLDVNLRGVLFCTKSFLPLLLDRPEAHIVNVSSMGGFVPVPGQTIYGAAKAAVKLLTEGLASELADTRVRVTVVFPGAIATNILANSGVSSPTASEGGGGMKALPASEAAAIIVHGMERNSRRVFAGKDAALMDKLCRLAPGFAARAIGNRMRALLPG